MSGPQYGPERGSDAYPLTPAADVAAARRALARRVIYYALGGRLLDQAREELEEFDTAPGADPDYLAPQELYGTDDPAELARIRDGELEDYERWGCDPFEEG